MYDKGFHIRHIRKQREQLQVVYESLSCLGVPFDLEGKDRTSSSRKIPVIELLGRAVRQRGVVDVFNLGMSGQIVDDLERVFHMALNPQ